MTVSVGHGRLVPNVEPEDTQSWETRLAAIRDELGREQVESVGDVLRVGNRLLAAAGIDVGAEFAAVAAEGQPAMCVGRVRAQTRD